MVMTLSQQATDAFHFFSSGQSKIQQGLLKEGYELISEALNLLNNVYGAMHSEIAACLRLLARLNYIMGDYPEVRIECGGGDGRDVGGSVHVRHVVLQLFPCEVVKADPIPRFTSMLLGCEGTSLETMI